MNQKHKFIEFLLEQRALTFGDFTLKSGRKSPYFLNVGLFNDGESLSLLSHFYANAIEASNFSYDVLFGPAYKGIPLVTATAIALYQKNQKKIPYCFNRKELKDHGEGSDMVGASIKGKRIVILDDVITAGTTVRVAVEIAKKHDATISGMIIAFDRQERGTGNLSAIEEAATNYNMSIKSVITLEDVLDYMTDKSELQEYQQRILDYYKTVRALNK